MFYFFFLLFSIYYYFNFSISFPLMFSSYCDRSRRDPTSLFESYKTNENLIETVTFFFFFLAVVTLTCSGRMVHLWYIACFYSRDVIER